MSCEELIGFINDPRLKYFMTMSMSLSRIFLYERACIEKSISLQMYNYKVGIIFPSVALIVYLLVLYFLWVKRYQAQLFATVQKIKMVFELVSFSSIELDDDLLYKVSKNVQTLKFLY